MLSAGPVAAAADVAFAYTPDVPGENNGYPVDGEPAVIELDSVVTAELNVELEVRMAELSVALTGATSELLDGKAVAGPLLATLVLRGRTVPPTAMVVVISAVLVDVVELPVPQ